MNPNSPLAASVEFRGARDWTERDRRAVAKWLREQVSDLIRNGEDYGRKTISIFLYEPERAGVARKPKERTVAAKSKKSAAKKRATKRQQPQ